MNERASNPVHLEADELSNYLLGSLPDDRHSQIDAHLSVCEECCEYASALDPRDRLANLLAAVHAEAIAPSSRSKVFDTTIPSSWKATPLEHPPMGSCDIEPSSDATEFPLPTELANHPRYQVLRPLGRGGMGEVWLAEHSMMGRRVAIKMLRPELTGSPELRERFQRELACISKLKHPNIAAAYDAEEIGKSTFLVMEWIDGENLLARIDRGPLSIGEACRMVRAIATGLSHAHAQGLIHRDVKPSNIMIDRDGTPKLLDFGLVVVADGGSAVTSHGTFMGTPDYIAPEQAEDPRSANAQSDIYSLGCTLYHLLSGQVPFPEPSTLRKLDAHRFQKPRPIQGLPAALTNLLDRMMAKKPGDRLASMDEVARRLHPFLTQQETAAGQPLPNDAGLPSGRPSRRRYLVASGCLVGAASLAWLGRSGINFPFRSARPPENPPPAVPARGPSATAKPVLRKEFALSEPTSLAQGTRKNYRIEGTTLSIDTLKTGQLWLNYLEHFATDLEVRCDLVIHQSSVHSFFKLVLMEHNEVGSEYSFQLRRDHSPGEIRLEHGDLKLHKTKSLWEGKDPTQYAKSPIGFGLRLIGNQLTALIDNQAVAEVEVPRTTKCFVCLSAWGCVADAHRLALRAYS